MKRIIDRTRSKRPILQPDEKDYHHTTEQVNRITEAVKNIERDISFMEKCPEYTKIVQDSYGRMLEIAMKRMSFPVNEIEKHAEIVGQFNERLRLTEELLSARNRLVERKGLLDRTIKKLTRLAKSLNLTGDTEDGF